MAADFISADTPGLYVEPGGIGTIIQYSFENTEFSAGEDGFVSFAYDLVEAMPDSSEAMGRYVFTLRQMEDSGGAYLRFVEVAAV